MDGVNDLVRVDEAAVVPLTIFAGSSKDDIASAKSLWKSLDLQPPIESRLVSSDIRQRKPIAKYSNNKSNTHSDYYHCKGEQKVIDRSEKSMKKVMNILKQKHDKEIHLINLRREDYQRLFHAQQQRRKQKEVHHNL